MTCQEAEIIKIYGKKTHAPTHRDTHTHKCTHTCMRMHVHTCIHMHTYMHAQAQMSMSSCSYVRK